MGLTRIKFGKRQNCDNIRSMTLSGVTVTGVNCTNLSIFFFKITTSFMKKMMTINLVIQIGQQAL